MGIMYEVDGDDLTSIANKIRTKGGTSASLEFPDGFKDAVDAIQTGITPTGTKNISTNGTHDVTNYASANVAVPASAVDSGTKNINSNGTHDVIGYASAAVSVPNTYSQSDEGKVVQSGALVSQSSATYTENGTYDTTLKNEVVVDVQGGSSEPVLLASETATEDVSVMTISYDPATMSGYTYFEMEIEGVATSARPLYPCPQINTTSNKQYNGYVGANAAFHFYAPVVPYYSGNSHNIQGYRVSIGSSNTQQAVSENTISSFSYASFYADGGFKTGTVFKIWGIA